MSEPKYTPAQIEAAISHRFGLWHNQLVAQQASPMLCISQGHVGVKRSEPELVLSLPADMVESGSLDWLIEATEATLAVLRNQRDRVMPNIVTGTIDGGLGPMGADVGPSRLIVGPETRGE